MIVSDMDWDRGRQGAETRGWQIANHVARGPEWFQECDEVVGVVSSPNRPRWVEIVAAGCGQS